MSTDGAFERAGILARGRQYLLGGRFHDSLPDDVHLERSANGRPKPYAVLHFGTIYAQSGDRSIMGEEDQPHVMPFSVACYAQNAEAARDTAGAVRDLFIGWTPSPGSEPIAAPGGSSYRDRDSSGAPTLFVESVAFETVINVGSNEGFVPSAGTMAPGGAPLATVENLIAAALATHIADPEPHPAYDDIVNLTLLFENRLV